MYEAFSYSCCDKCMRPSATSVCEALSYLGGGGAVEGGGGLKLLVHAALSYLGGGGAVA